MSASSLQSPQPSLKPCGEPRCRVCRALGFYDRRRYPAGRGLTREHHPLSSPAARARAERIHAAMLELQRELGRLANQNEIADAVGLKRSGLVSIYLARMAASGRVVRRSVPGPGRYRWEAIA